MNIEDHQKRCDHTLKKSNAYYYGAFMLVKLIFQVLGGDHLTAYQDFKASYSQKQWCGPSLARIKKDGTISTRLASF